MKKLLILLMLLCQGCSVTVVIAPKDVFVQGKENIIELKGSDLDGNNLDGSADGNNPSLTLPIK